MLLRALLYLLVSSLSFGQETSVDHEQNEVGQSKCEVNKEMLHNLGLKFETQCAYNYHHYNSESSSEHYLTGLVEPSKVRIGSFNLLKPGHSSSRYKDLSLVASIINKWDVVAAQELVPLVSYDEINNDNVTSFLAKKRSDLSKLKRKIKSERNKTKLKKYKSDAKKMTSEIKIALKIYRLPGFLNILNKLRKLDPSWSLIISPRGESKSAKKNSELIGFYYRATTVSPMEDRYCDNQKEIHEGFPTFACYVDFKKSFMGKNYGDYFLRRPMIAGFRSGSFTFRLLNAHVISDSPNDSLVRKSMVRKIFKVSDIDELKGVTSDNYARFVEASLTLKFMQKYKDRYRENDLIYLGDLNLEKSNPFWSEILPEFKGAKILIDQPTSLSTSKTTNGTETGGLSKNFDHFILNPTTTSECIFNSTSNYGVLSFFKGSLAKKINDRYIVRTKSGRLIDSKVEKVERKHLNPYILKDTVIRTIKNGKIIEDIKRMDKYINDFKSRIIDSQVDESSYYRVYHRILSDHMPIFLTCKTN